MVAAFSGLHIGTSAIHASQMGLNVTGQNIANSATPGYSRQRVDLEAVGGPGVPAFWSKYDGTGEGVRVTDITRMTDQFLVARANHANASLGKLEEQQKTMAALERIVGEPSDTGLQKKLQEMWNAFGDAANGPTLQNEAPRAQALSRAKDVAAQLNLMGESLATQWQDTGAELNANITAVNKMAEDVAKLNNAIRNNNIARVPSNELLDQRDELIRQISELTGATTQPAQMDQGVGFDSQAVDVVLNGHLLVNGTKANALESSYTPGQAYPPGTDAPPEITVTWKNAAVKPDGSPGAAAGTAALDDTGSGRLSGQLDNMNNTIPTYMAQFDAVAQKVAEVVNAEQTTGAYTVDPVNHPAAALFVSDSGSFTARSIKVDPDAVPNSIAVSKGNPAANALDGDNAREISRHINDPGGADETYKAMVVKLGVETQSVNRNVQVQQNVVMKAEDARDNVSGVSLNEEMTNMIQFQHSFSAAAKFIATIDQTLDTLINMKR